MPVEDQHEITERHLATATEMLIEEGHRDVAALLVDAVLEYEVAETLFNMSHMDAPNAYRVRAILHVPTVLHRRFDEGVNDLILDTLKVHPSLIPTFGGNGSPNSCRKVPSTRPRSAQPRPTGPPRIGCDSATPPK